MFRITLLTVLAAGISFAACAEDFAGIGDDSIEFGIVNTGDYVINTNGGTREAASFIGNLDVTVSMDTERAGLWGGGRAFFSALDDYGGTKPSAEYIGDLQTADNIEAARELRIFELWYEQRFFSGGLSVLCGLHDLNSEFAVTEYGSLYINSSFGIQPDISANAPVSIFPVTSLAVRVKVQTNGAYYVEAAVYDGDPGAPDVNRFGTKWYWSEAEGVMTIYEMGARIGGKKDSAVLPCTYKLGGWYHTAIFPDVFATDNDGAAVKHKGNRGIYFIADQMIYAEDEKKEQGLGVFCQIGAAPDDRSQVGMYAGCGFNYRGLFPMRDEDDIGCAVAHARLSSKARNGGGRDAAETAIEMTYAARITPWFSFQPDVQFIMDTGASSAVKDAAVVILRTVVSF